MSYTVLGQASADPLDLAERDRRARDALAARATLATSSAASEAAQASDTASGIMSAMRSGGPLAIAAGAVSLLLLGHMVYRRYRSSVDYASESAARFFTRNRHRLPRKRRRSR